MIVDLPQKLEAALKLQANAHGVSPAGYVCEVLERSLASSLQARTFGVPFKTGRGSLAKYGKAPSSDDIEANRTEMLCHSAE